ncbi:MAG: hypothetical protein PHS97_03060 [Oscillospiraceae bacterium]|nr:hypothetical protein [Oscillospiraceae bacterium]
MNRLRSALALLVMLALLCPVAHAADDTFSENASHYGGEWALIALARADGAGDAAQAYAADLAAQLESCGGVLSTRRYTEYSRVVLALTAIGRDARRFAGFDLTAPLADYGAVVQQGLNGAIYALLAVDSGQYACAAREDYIRFLLSRALPSGGFCLTGQSPDPDVTAMALSALAPYQSRVEVAACVQAALLQLSALQEPSGGFSSFGAETCESTAQVILALCSLGISPDDARFVQNGHTAADALAAFATGSGYAHILGGAQNRMASEQAALANAALSRAAAGQCALYDMTDVPSFRDAAILRATRALIFKRLGIPHGLAA